MKMYSRPIHGSINPNELRTLGLKQEILLDFSANISPIGVPNGVCEDIQRVDLEIYPDPECLEIREAISKYISNPSQQIPIEKIFVGNGSNEILHLISRIYLSKKSTVLVMTPTYGEYEFACRLSGARVIKFNANVDTNFRWDFRDVSDLIKTKKPHVVIICNPNNPTGIFCKRHEIDTLARISFDSGSMLIIDEAYLSFVAKPWNSLSLLKYTNVVLVRSMSKDFALTALRLGYALSSEDVVSSLRFFQPEWSVNSLAQKIGILALEDNEYIHKAREVVSTAKNYLKKALTELGFETINSDANFILIRVGNASKWRTLLLKKGFVVRDCTSFDLPNYMRVGIRVIEDCKLLVKAIKEVAQDVN